MMKIPFRVVFTNMAECPLVIAAADERLEKLTRRFAQISACLAILEAQPHGRFSVVLEIHVLGVPIVVSREPPRTRLVDALTGAFRVAARALETTSIQYAGPVPHRRSHQLAAVAAPGGRIQLRR